MTVVPKADSVVDSPRARLAACFDEWFEASEQPMEQAEELDGEPSEPPKVLVQQMVVLDFEKPRDCFDCVPSGQNRANRRRIHC